MRTQFLAASLLVVGAQFIAAQQPAAPPSSVPLEGIAAVVGDQIITRFDLEEQFLGKIQRHEVDEPKTRADSMKIRLDVLNDMIEEDPLLQKAKDLKIEVTDADITPAVDQQVKQVRAGFSNETEFRSALAKAGMGTPEEYRRYLMDQLRRRYTHEKVLQKLRQDGKIIPVNVTDAEVAAEFEREKPFLGPRPASVTFKQIVIAPQPTAAAKEVARIKAESLLAQIKGGADFDR